MSVMSRKEGVVEPTTEAMLYSAESLKAIEDFKDRMDEFLSNAALNHAKRQELVLISEDDVRAILDELKWQIPDEAD